MRELRHELGGGLDPGIGVVDAVDAVLGHQDRVRADLERTQGGCGVGREERVAGSGGEDHDPPLLEMADPAAPDVRLGHLGHADRGQDARVRPEPLQDVLECERVEERREHPGVVRRRAVHALGRRGHAAVDVPRADDDPDLDAGLLAVDDLLGDRLDARELEAELLVAHQRLAGELEQDAVERGCALRSS